MIRYLKGKVIENKEDFIVIYTNGVGYKVYYNRDLKVNEDASLFIYTRVTEKDISFFGFNDTDELALFESLISVTNVGPKTAYNMIGLYSPDLVIKAIDSGDVKFLTKFPGIGEKTAQQIVLKLAGKLVLEEEVNENLKDAIDALKGLGLKDSDVSKFEDEYRNTNMSVEEYIDKILSEIRGGLNE